MKISKSLIGLSLALVVLFPFVTTTPALGVDESEVQRIENQKVEMMRVKAMTGVSGWNMSHATWMTTPDAAYYNLYYKMAGAKTWQHSVRMLPKTSSAVDIKFLMKGKKYVYIVAAAKPNGVEFWWSKEMPMKTMMMK